MNTTTRQIVARNQVLTIGTLTNGEYLRVSGSQIVSAAVAVGGGGSATWTAFVQNVGNGFAGTFDLTGLSGLSSGKYVDVRQSSAVIPSKGDARDEIEFDRIECSGYVVNSTTIRVSWTATGLVSGDYAFVYCVSA